MNVTTKQPQPWELTPDELNEVRLEWRGVLTKWENDKLLGEEVGDIPNYESMVSAKGQKKLIRWVNDSYQDKHWTDFLDRLQLIRGWVNG